LRRAFVFRPQGSHLEANWRNTVALLEVSTEIVRVTVAQFPGDFFHADTTARQQAGAFRQAHAPNIVPERLTGFPSEEVLEV
jgi:hypothetical protein